MPDEVQMVELTPEKHIIFEMNELLRLLQAAKPNDRTDKDRKFAIVITEMEKVRAIAKDFLA